MVANASASAHRVFPARRPADPSETFWASLYGRATLTRAGHLPTGETGQRLDRLAALRPAPHGPASAIPHNSTANLVRH